MSNKNRTTREQIAIECTTIVALLFAMSFIVPYIIIFLLSIPKG